MISNKILLDCLYILKSLIGILTFLIFPFFIGIIDIKVFFLIMGLLSISFLVGLWNKLYLFFARVFWVRCLINSLNKNINKSYFFDSDERKQYLLRFKNVLFPTQERYKSIRPLKIKKYENEGRDICIYLYSRKSTYTSVKLPRGGIVGNPCCYCYCSIIIEQYCVGQEQKLALAGLNTCDMTGKFSFEDGLCIELATNIKSSTNSSEVCQKAYLVNQYIMNVLKILNK